MFLAKGTEQTGSYAFKAGAQGTLVQLGRHVESLGVGGTEGQSLVNAPSGAKRKGSGGVWEEGEVRNRECEWRAGPVAGTSTVTGAETTGQGGTDRSGGSV